MTRPPSRNRRRIVPFLRPAPEARDAIRNQQITYCVPDRPLLPAAPVVRLARDVRRVAASIPSAFLPPAQFAGNVARARRGGVAASMKLAGELPVRMPGTQCPVARDHLVGRRRPLRPVHEIETS